MTWSISSALTPACSRAAIVAVTPRSVAVWFFSFPPNVPNAVRLAPTMNAPGSTKNHTLPPSELIEGKLTLNKTNLTLKPSSRSRWLTII